MSTIFTRDGLRHDHNAACIHALLADDPAPLPVDAPTTHQWRRIDYADDVVPWHCMVCDEFDTDRWEGPCPTPKP